MPGKNCCIPDCGTNRRKSFDGISIFKVKKENTAENRKWRADILNMITKFREVDASFRQQISCNTFRICELHFEPHEVIPCKYQHHKVL